MHTPTQGTVVLPTLVSSQQRMPRWRSKRAVPPVTCDAILHDTLPDQVHDDVWILYDTGSAVIVCRTQCQEVTGTRDDATGPRCEASGTAVTLGRAKEEVLVVIVDTSFIFKFRVASVTKPIASPRWVQSSLVHHSDLEVWRMQNSHDVATGDRIASQATHLLAERVEDRELISETDKDMLEVLEMAVVASARWIPVLPPLALSQKHRSEHLSYRCASSACGCERTEKNVRADVRSLNARRHDRGCSTQPLAWRTMYW